MSNDPRNKMITELLAALVVDDNFKDFDIQFSLLMNCFLIKGGERSVFAAVGTLQKLGIAKANREKLGYPAGYKLNSDGTSEAVVIF